MKLEFSRETSEKNSQISNFIKIRSVGGDLFHADRQTDTQDMATLPVSLRHSAKAPNKMANKECQSNDNKTGKGKKTHRQCPETLRKVFGHVR